MQSNAHIGTYYGNKDLSQVEGRILLPFSGTIIEKFTVI